MDVQGITPQSATAQSQAMTQETASVLVLKKALDAQSSQAMQLVQLMNQSTGIGTSVDVQA